MSISARPSMHFKKWFRLAIYYSVLVLVGLVFAMVAQDGQQAQHAIPPGRADDAAKSEPASGQGVDSPKTATVTLRTGCQAKASNNVSGGHGALSQRRVCRRAGQIYGGK
jgi:hypothetical protein